MPHATPTGPWDNPIIHDGTYDATVVEIIESTYGDFPMVKIVFHLTDVEVHFVTHIYFPHGNSIHAEQRLWHFCRIVRLDTHDVLHQPELVAGRKLCLRTYTVAPSESNQDHPYCDVELFLPAKTPITTTSAPIGADPFGVFSCDV